MNNETEYSQIKFNKEFIKKLLGKLKIGNTRSIHLNVLPGRSATRLDLSLLEKIHSGLPKMFIEKLLTEEQFSFNIAYDKVELGNLDEDQQRDLTLLSKRLNNLVIENNDNFLEFGIKNFGFGYPVLIKRDQNDPSKIIKAPLFIWSLEIEKSYQNKNSWTVKKNEDSPIKINELLVSHLSKDESIQLEKIPSDILEDGILDEEELISLTNQVLSQLNEKEQKLEIKIQKCPDKKTIESIASSRPWIQWSGVFGMYRSQKQTIIRATEELLERFDEFNAERLVLKKFQTSTVSAVETDPSKEEIVNTLTQSEIKLIQGPPGTGKSQSITAIISNALANNAKCLIVCEKKTALNVIQSNLKKIGLGDFSIVIDDVNKDRKKVIEKARNIKGDEDLVQFHEFEFREDYKKFKRLKNELNNKYKAPLIEVFTDHSWKDLIGLYLRYSKSKNFNSFAEKISYTSLEFNNEEIYKYSTVITEASSLSEYLEEKSEEDFTTINNSVFEKEYKWSIHEKIKKDVDISLQSIEKVLSFLKLKDKNDIKIGEINPFSPKALSSFLGKVEKLSSTLNKELECFKKGEKLIGSQFNQESILNKVSLNLKAFVSKDKKEALKLRNKIPKLTQKNLSLMKEINKSGHANLSIEESLDVKIFKKSLQTSLIDVKKIKKDAQNLLTFNTFINEVESELNKVISNKILKFNLRDEEKIKNLDDLISYYESLKVIILKCKKKFDAYEDFHNWKFFMSQRTAKELEIIEELKKVPSNEWVNILKAWYYKGALIKHEEDSDAGFNKSDTKLKQISNLYEKLQKGQLNQIKSIWKNKRQSELRAFSHNFNALYNLRKNKSYGRRNSLRKIIETDLKMFTTLFPIILINPDAVNAIFPLEQGLFDVVIFDEASQLRIADTFTSLIRGHYKIIAGDEHQMPPSNYFQSSVDLHEEVVEDEDITKFSEVDEQSVLSESESLLEYACNLKSVSKSYLDFHYRSQHPALIDFSNCAFYGGNLMPLPAQTAYKAIDFRPVNGIYDSRENKDEAIAVLQILKEEIHPMKDGQYPSVGIASFNINQRNLITGLINAASEEDLGFAKKAQALKARGLFVKNLENIQGDERDIIIISTTYGIKPDGKFSQNFSRLNRIEGYKLLNVLITRAKKKLYLCTSIPKERYLSYAEAIKVDGNNKKGILYAYLAYAESVSNNDIESAENILQLLKDQSFEKPRNLLDKDGLSESPFEEEVYEELKDHFDAHQIIQQHKAGGFRLDFVIKMKKRDIVLECDGKAYHQSEEAYAHDMHRQKEIENMGFLVYRIWSTNWFQNKELEMRKFLAYVESIDSQDK